jgi:hypothetical protein
MDTKKTVSLKLTETLDKVLDQIAAENVDLVGRSTFTGEPNRSEVVRALIATYDRRRLRSHLIRARRDLTNSAA